MADDPLFWVMTVAVLAVVVILMVGIGSFGKGGKFNQKNANKIMRWRIGAQLIAVLLILLFVYLRGEGA
ncbi:MAG: twin transmembrane helix small protein [Yoonia sp.]|uniref:twin transmembrane helix small protein n=1 Tax=Yoonia sp. TaxID=2212373 RepID=UPI003EF3C925